MDQLTSRMDTLLSSGFNSGPVDETNINAAEAELGLLFPPSYRLFLSRFGAVLEFGFEVYGLPPAPNPDQPPQWGNIIKSTVNLWPDGLPENSIQISHDGMDHGYFLRCSQFDRQFEGPIIEWGPDHNGGLVVASSFMEFMESRFRR